MKRLMNRDAVALSLRSAHIRYFNIVAMKIYPAIIA